MKDNKNKAERVQNKIDGSSVWQVKLTSRMACS